MNETDLIARLQKGEEAALRHLFEQLYPRLCYFARGILQNDVEAEGVVQEAFMKLWRQRQQFSSFAALRSFLYISARRACLNILKHQQIVFNHQSAEARAAGDDQYRWQQLNNDARPRGQLLSMPGTPATAAWERIQPRLAQQPPPPPVLHRVLLYAAAITGMLLGVGSLIYLLIHRDKLFAPISVAVIKQRLVPPITPGKSKASLVLGNGKVMELKDDQEQAFTEQDDTRIKSSAAVLTYSGAGVTQAPVYNTLETARGGEFRVILPDSSVVRLNAASSLRFPAQFTGSTRNVYLSGEAYFEIANNRNKPFIVSTNSISVTVTSAKFNVKAYPDESYVNTTLDEGAVQLSAKMGKITLHPGEEGVWENEKITVKAAYLEGALAWENGQFRVVYSPAFH